MRALLGYIRRFGFWRGIYLRRIASKCDRNPHLLASWAAHFRIRASSEFRRFNNDDGNAFLAFAEILSGQHDKLVLKKKPRRPILAKRLRKAEREVKRTARGKR